MWRARRLANWSHHLVRKVCSLVLVVLCFVVAAPAAAGPNRSPNADSPPAVELTSPGDEIIGLRTETSASFATPDSKVVETRVYSGPVHFKNSADHWQRINTKLAEDNGRARARTSKFDVDVALKGNDDQVARIEIDNNHSLALGLESGRTGRGKRSGNAVTITGAAKSADVRLEVIPTGLKFDIVLQDKNAAKRYVLPMKLENLSPRVEEGGAVVFVDENGEVRLVVPRGFMEDSAMSASGDAPRSYGVTYTLAELPGKKTALVIDLDSEWLTDATRVYPVVVDPDVLTPIPAGTGDTTVQSYPTPHDDYSNETWLKVGYCGGTCSTPAVTAQSFLKFDVSSLQGHSISSASLALTQYHSYSCDASKTMSVFPVTSGTFPPILSWSAKPALGSTALGTTTWVHGATCGGGTVEDTISLTPATISSWANDPTTNKGVGLKANNETVNASWRKFYSANNASGKPELRIWSTPPAPPGAPANATATSPSDGVVQANWNTGSGSGIDSYTIGRFPDGSSTMTDSKTCNVPCLSQSWTGLADGSKWYFKIWAHNAAGFGLPATTASATAKWKPSAPVRVAAWPGNGQAQVKWSAAGANNGPAIQGYKVTVTNVTTGAAQTTEVSASARSHIMSGLTNGNPHYFTVRAFNQWGDGASTNSVNSVTGSVNFTPSATPTPYGPEYVYTSPGNGSAWVSWQRPKSNGASAPYTFPTHYTVQVFEGSTGVYQTTVVASTSTTSGSLKVPGLVNGHTYTVRLFPYNSTANAWGDYVEGYPNVTPSSDPPPFPARNVNATPGSSSVLVSWDAPDPSGPTAGVKYFVQGLDVATGAVDHSVTTTKTAHRFLTLQNDRTFVYLINAFIEVGGTNKMAGGAMTNEASPSSSLGSLLDPTNVQIAERGDKRVRVTWTNAVAATDYKIQAYLVSDGQPIGPETLAISGSANDNWVGGLQNGKAVTVKVTGRFGVPLTSPAILEGDGTTSLNSMTPAGAPFAPAKPALARGDGTLTATWAAPADQGGVPGNNGDDIKNYVVRVYWEETDQEVYRLPVCPEPQGCQSPPTTLTIQNLAPGEDYSVTVAAANGVGEGPPSEHSDSVTFARRPDAPNSGLVATAGKQSADVSWDEPVANGDSIDYYTVFAHSPGHGTLSEPTTQTSVHFEGLTAEREYTFTVTATNGVGTSEPAGPSQPPVTPYGPPDPPTDLLVRPGDTRLSGCWNAAQPRGAAVTGYRITVNPPDAASKTVPTNQLCESMDGLVNGTTYDFTVVALSDLGGDSLPLTGRGTPVITPLPSNIQVVIAADRREVVGFNFYLSVRTNAPGVDIGVEVEGANEGIVGRCPWDGAATNACVSDESSYADWTYSGTQTGDDSIRVFLDSNHNDQWESGEPNDIVPVSWDEPVDYVALGDSFSSGEGVGDYYAGTDNGTNECHRSASAYGATLAFNGYNDPISELAGTNGVTWDFRACSGAVIANVTADPAKRRVQEGTTATQLEGINPNTDMISISIGGNDMSFVDILKFCAFRDCFDGRVFDDRDSRAANDNLPLGQWLETTAGLVKEELKALYTEMKNATNNQASIFVLGYPRLFPESGDERGCGKLTPWHTGVDVMQQLNEWTSYFNATIKAAAVETGVWFVPVENAFIGHAVCGTAGEWLFGPGPGDVWAWPPPDEEEIRGDFHPNGQGQYFYGVALRGQIHLKTAAGNPLNPNGVPQNPSPGTPQ